MALVWWRLVSLARANSGYLNNYLPPLGCGSCYRSIGGCIQTHKSNCGCANNSEYFIEKPEFNKDDQTAYQIKPDKVESFKACMESN